MTFPACSDRRDEAARGAIRAFARALAALALLPLAAWGFDPFVVRDIRVEGVQRTDAGTIFSYLPIKVGERVDDEKVAQAVKALYATGFFRDVRIEAEGNVLLVVVQERPTISSITFVGNKEFDTDTVKKALRDIGIAEARIFDRSALERAEQELKRQYITRGLYSASVQTTVTPQERNRVAINFAITEGDPAKIARINIVGNQAYSERQLLSEITLSTPTWISWYTKSDQYSKQKLQADLETLRSFYQNNGYLEFEVLSTQVSIAPAKDDVFITINVKEGPRFTISDVRIAGDLVVPETELRALIRVKPGDTFSREKLQASTKDMSDRLGSEGYAFANVNAVPEIDQKQATAAFTFFVDPGRRVYVRKVNISGNVKTRDEVIRREVRQLESGWFDSARIERSKVRIRRLGYFEDVNIETPPVAGTSDQVDLEISVTERNTGNLLAGVGYSSSEGLVFSASVSQQNVFGSGNAVSLGINTSQINRTISLLFTEPYWTVDGISRTIEFYQKNLDPANYTNVAQYQSSTLGAAIGFGVPVSETDTIVFGLRAERTEITLFEGSPLIYYQYVADFGDSPSSLVSSVGWSRDTRDDVLYPTRGRLQSAVGEIGLPIADLTYWKAQYLHQWFFPVFGQIVGMLRVDIGYADGYSGKPLPFFKAFYGGGPASVRGYETASLGPRDLAGTVLGGKRKIIGNAEAYYPILKGEKAVRLSVFADAGQIWVPPDEIPQLLKDLYPGTTAFRYSVGAGLSWNSPLGPLKFSYAFPLATKPYDNIQRFQFQVGSVF